MHAGENNDLDGWYLAAFDVPSRGGDYTAVSGMRLDQALAGGFHGMPPMSEIIKKYNPQVVILMLGTNDASADRSVAEYKADLEKAVKLILGQRHDPGAQHDPAALQEDRPRPAVQQGHHRDGPQAQGADDRLLRRDPRPPPG